MVNSNVLHMSRAVSQTENSIQLRHFDSNELADFMDLD
mgnify:CR=1 FL=1